MQRVPYRGEIQRKCRTFLSSQRVAVCCSAFHQPFVFYYLLTPSSYVPVLGLTNTRHLLSEDHLSDSSHWTRTLLSQHFWTLLSSIPSHWSNIIAPSHYIIRPIEVAYLNYKCVDWNLQRECVVIDFNQLKVETAKLLVMVPCRTSYVTCFYHGLASWFCVC